MRIFFFLLGFLLYGGSLVFGLDFHPKTPFPGAPILLEVPQGVEAVEFLSRRYLPFPYRGKRFVLLAVPLETKPGRYPVIFKGTPPLTITIYPKVYPEEHLKVPPKMVRYPPKILARIKKEICLIRETVSGFTPHPLLSGPFVWPAPGRLSSPFGLRRVYNGEPRSPHSGVDIACPEGTPVKAANRGRVVLTGDFYLPGKIVILDHGLGIYTVYCHLSKILVHKGMLLEKGEVLALSGRSGRVTGPHLHFGCYIEGTKVDPKVLLEVF